VTFGPRHSASVPFDDGTGSIERVEVRFSYSFDGPPHWELLEIGTGHPVHDAARPGLHHLGLWAGDVRSVVHRLEGHGLQCPYRTLDPGGRWFTAYVEDPRLEGLPYVEYVDDGTREGLERFWKTGELSDASNIEPTGVNGRGGGPGAEDRRASAADDRPPGLAGADSTPLGCPWHLVVPVADLDDARRTFGSALGCRFGPARRLSIRSGESRKAELAVASVSSEGPPYVVLLNARSRHPIALGQVHVLVAVPPSITPPTGAIRLEDETDGLAAAVDQAGGVELLLVSQGDLASSDSLFARLGRGPT
jgi:hypothetical protein